jgi:hypothetical protein
MDVSMMSREMNRDLLEAYTPAQVRACSRMLDAVLSVGKTIEEFLALAHLMHIWATDPTINKLRLVFPLGKQGGSIQEGTGTSVNK